MIVRDVADGGFVWVNQLFTERLGWTAEDLVEKPLAHWVDAADRLSLKAVLDAGHGKVRSRHLGQDRDPISLDWTIRTEEYGLVALGVLAGKGTSCAVKAETALPEGDSLGETLKAIALIIEDQHPGRYCSILLLDEDRQRVSIGAGPSLPAEYNAAVEGLAIGPSVGSCGTAAYWGQRVLVENIQEEGLWRDLKQYAAMAGVAACWSHPINSRTGEVIGALALYNSVPSAPTPRELSGLEMAAKMVALAIERGRAEQTLRESEARAQFQAHLLTAVTDVMTSFVDKNDWGTAASRFVRAAMDLTESESGVLAVVESSEIEALADATEVRSVSYRDVIRYGDLSFAEFEPFLTEITLSAYPVGSVEPAGEPRFSRRLPESGSKLRSVLGSPIRVDGDVVAVLCVGNTVEEYGDRDGDAVSVLCRAASELFDAYRRQSREAALEDHLRQAAKMEAIGVLAGGIAHDFNNMLAVVQGSAELALDLLPEETSARHLLSEILAASQKSHELCNQMLAYAGRGLRSMQPLDANTLIQELGDLQKVTLSKKAHLRYDLSPEPMFIEADRAQMNQVVMNLITNAAEALGDTEGEIVVTTATQTYDRQELDRHQGSVELETGEYVCIAVRDTGCGMGRNTQEKIYDPFFTTKFTGRGLGLAAVRGIVRGHKGAINVESKEGRGTIFAVLVPRVGAPAACSEVRSSELTARIAVGKRILVVDDEPAVRKVQTRVLERAGYDVLSASDGQEAVEIFEREGDSIDCVLLDLSMPRLNGEETLQALRKLRGDVRVVLTSGFTEQEMLDRSSASGFNAVVQKPFVGATLVETIREVLV